MTKLYKFQILLMFKLELEKVLELNRLIGLSLKKMDQG